ncbi:MAG: hypothetical protein IKG42_02465 [Clostridia bacterium]|nr:hypothetical protein [Clostridia bacterium]
MKKQTLQKILKVVGILYLIAAIGLIALSVAVFNNSISDITDAIKNSTNITVPGDITAEQVVGIGLITSAVFDLFIGWALLRAAKNPEKSLLACIILTLGFIGAVLSMIGSKFEISSIIRTVIDGFMFFVIIRLRSIVNNE